MSGAPLLAPVLERALNGYLDRDPDTATRLAALEGKRLALELSGLEQSFLLSVADGRLRVDTETELEPDATLRGTTLAFSKLALGSDPTAGLASGELVIEGDTQVGEAFRALFTEVEIDWEEALSRLLGDIPAHQVGSWLRSLQRWGRRSVTSLRMDLTEYLQEESQALPTRVEVEAFLDDVDDLRADVDRLEARIRRLEQHDSGAEDRDGS
ncbi:MAG: SCP2 sterol-binding domain-containing protein [Chromatiales bacterium]|jgi:ubiquinone biosynthesis protein UbiJ